MAASAGLAARLNRPVWTMLLVALAYALFLFAYLHQESYDLSAFIAAGDHFADPEAVPPGISVRLDSNGYDGQFYYLLALDPFPEEPRLAGLRLDSPAYRQQRILYPLLVHLLSGGRNTLVPVLLVLVNWLGLCLLGWLGGVLALRAGRHALWGATLALFPGFLFTLSRDLTEIIAAILFLVSLLLVLRRQHLPGAMVLSVAVFAKETTVLLAMAALLLAAWRWFAARDDSQTAGEWRALALYGLIPVLVYGAWQIVLTVRWDVSALAEGQGNIGLPLLGLLDFTGRVGEEGRLRAGITLLHLAALFYWTVVVARVWRSNPAGRLIRWGWLLYGLLAASLTTLVWVEDQAYLRALTEYYLLGALLLLHGRGNKRWKSAFAVMGLLWLLVTVDLLLIRA